MPGGRKTLGSKRTSTYYLDIREASCSKDKTSEVREEKKKQTKMAVKYDIFRMDCTRVADQRFSLKEWFVADAYSCRLRRTGPAHCYLRIFCTGRAEEKLSWSPLLHS